MTAFRRSRVPSIEKRHWDRLAPLFVHKGSKVEPAQLRSRSGMRASSAVALVLGLFEEHCADLFWLVYHCENHPVRRRPYAQGFLPVPWKCPDCGEVIEDPDDLRYDLQAVLRSRVEFV